MKLNLKIIRRVKTNEINIKEVVEYAFENMKNIQDYSICRLDLEVYLYNNINKILKLFAGVEIKRGERVNDFGDLLNEALNYAKEIGIPLK